MAGIWRWSDMHSLICVTYDFVKQCLYPDQKYYVILVIVCDLSMNHFVHRLSVRPSLCHDLPLLAPQRDKWHLNNNNIEFYWNHFVHLSLNTTCIYLDLKSLYDKLYALWKKSSVWQNFVQSDKISNSVRPMSDKSLEYFESTVQ